jgi:phosphatidylglycerol:prolipoprotein diacylglycerol transferase|tara:strand:+ start:4241 stop:5023 length:783 start_codon:yes stop_codon:yes gene_type:complete
MFTHNLDPILINFGFISLRWYSLAYIFGILIGWWYGKKIIKKFKNKHGNFLADDFDDLITYLIFGIVIGGRVGYVIFYNLNYYIENPLDIIKIWQGGMSFHGALIGIIIGTFFFSYRRDKNALFFLDIIACVSPIGIFFGRIANFINGELVGKISSMPWSVIFPNVDMMPRHPSQIYEAILEGVILFLIVNFFINKKEYIIGTCSYIFLISYGALRIVSEFFREPDLQLGYIFNIASMGSILSFVMFLSGIAIFYIVKKR